MLLRQKKLFLLSPFWVVIFLLFAAINPSKALAQVCSNFQVEGNVIPPNSQNPTWVDSITIRFKIENVNPADTFIVCTDTCRQTASSDYVRRGITASEIKAGVITFNGKSNTLGKHSFHIRNEKVAPGIDIPGCSFTYEVITTNRYSSCQLNITSEDVNGKTFTPDTRIYIRGSQIIFNPQFGYSITVKGPNERSYSISPDNAENAFPRIELGRFLGGSYQVILNEIDPGAGNSAPTDCQTGFSISYDGGDQEGTPTVPGELENICVNVKPPSNQEACKVCFDAGKTWTALGCIPTNNLNDLVGWFLGRLIFIATGIAFLLLVFGALQILTSAGNPEKVKAGSELITSTIAGLLLIILSLFLLKLIGVDILHLPGFSK